MSYAVDPVLFEHCFRYIILIGFVFSLIPRCTMIVLRVNALENVEEIGYVSLVGTGHDASRAVSIIVIVSV